MIPSAKCYNRVLWKLWIGIRSETRTQLHTSALYRALRARFFAPGCFVIAKFHYTDPTGPARTQRSFAAKKVRAGPCGSGRVRVVEFSCNVTWTDKRHWQSNTLTDPQCTLHDGPSRNCCDRVTAYDVLPFSLDCDDMSIFIRTNIQAVVKFKKNKTKTDENTSAT